jgi:glutamine synthetase adenylyltransferase
VSTWLVAWFVIGVVTTVALIAFLIALTRHALVLGRSARQMQEAVQPIADEISRQTARQQRKVAEMRSKVPTMGAGRTDPGRGGR